MNRLAIAAVLACLYAPLTLAQTEGDSKEQYELSQAVSEAGTSSIDLIRALELHLQKYPASQQRAPIEKALAKSSMETNDTARIIRYGEVALKQSSPPDPNDVMPMLDRVTRALVEKEDPAQAKRAIEYAKRYQGDVAAMRAKMEPPGHLTTGQWSEELDKMMA